MVTKYRKKPVVIDALQWDGSEESSHEIIRFCNMATWNIPINTIVIDTLEGTMRVDEKDYVIKGVAGEFYPCKPDIFVKTYDKLSD